MIEIENNDNLVTSDVSYKNVIKQSPEDIRSFIEEKGKEYLKNSSKTLDLLQNLSLFPTPESVGTLGIVYPKIYDGGVERVISLQIPIFLGLGYKVVLITEEIREDIEFTIPDTVTRCVIPKKIKDGRVGELLNVIRNTHIDLVIHHASNNHLLFWDILSVRLLRKALIICKHEVTAGNFMVGLNEKNCPSLLKSPNCLGWLMP